MKNVVIMKKSHTHTHTHTQQKSAVVQVKTYLF